VELDMSLAAPPFEREIIERARELTIRGAKLRIASPEDIVVMKAIALRPRDIADIEAIVELHPDLDLERIRGLLKTFTEALESGDFAAEFERIFSRVRRARGTP
jgi:predicted nucleotidyltransferase